MERDLRRDIDDMLDFIYGSTGAHAGTTASVRALFTQVKEVAQDIRRGKQHHEFERTPTGNGSTQDAMYLD
jgi:hypothetical protein